MLIIKKDQNKINNFCLYYKFCILFCIMNKLFKQVYIKFILRNIHLDKSLHIFINIVQCQIYKHRIYLDQTSYNFNNQNQYNLLFPFFPFCNYLLRYPFQPYQLNLSFTYKQKKKQNHLQLFQNQQHQQHSQNFNLNLKL